VYKLNKRIRSICNGNSFSNWLQNTEGKVRAKYSHYDGYVAGAGKTLQEHYTQARKIAQMVELGDQSYMDKEIFPMPGSGHSFKLQKKALQSSTDVTEARLT